MSLLSFWKLEDFGEAPNAIADYKAEIASIEAENAEYADKVAQAKAITDS